MGDFKNIHLKRYGKKNCTFYFFIYSSRGRNFSALFLYFSHKIDKIWLDFSYHERELMINHLLMIREIESIRASLDGIVQFQILSLLGVNSSWTSYVATHFMNRALTASVPDSFQECLYSKYFRKQRFETLPSRRKFHLLSGKIKTAPPFIERADFLAANCKIFVSSKLGFID